MKKQYKKKRFDKFKNLSPFQKFRKILRDKIYLLIRKVIDFYYHKKLSKYKDLKILLNKLSLAKKKIIGEGPRTADISDCMALYEDIIAIKPNFILELGPGSSTAAICLAINKLKDIDPNYAPTFIAIESQKFWFDFYKKIIPNELFINVKLILRDELTGHFLNKKMAYYEDIPKFPYEYIHVDGPDIHGLGVDLQSDLFVLEKYLNPNCLIIFDGRRNAARFFRDNTKNFNFRRHPITLNHMLSKKAFSKGFILDFLKYY